ncbi:venom serine protease Bi-VSP [Drosophila subobscura]|uniref:venom serine protease Bi-VSP n=1 Tax=Drosophila subobscura TaxID=7241 RepID=UPI00155A8D46|nr:venom serine protease Bi-VSP [Drosophila subobscura]
MGITMVHFLANTSSRHSSQLLAKQHGHGCGYGYGIGYVAWKSHIMVLLEEFCVKVYFWPFLSYLASIKGWCPLYPPGYYPVYTWPQPQPQPQPPPFPPLPPTGPLIPPPPALPPTPPGIPTFQPTPPNPQTPFTPPLITTSSSTSTSTTLATTTTTTGVTTTSTAGTTLPVPTCPPQPLVCLPGGVRPLPNCPCIDPRQNAPLVAATGLVGSDMMVFMPLNAKRRRRRRRRPQTSCYDARSRPGSCLPLTSCSHLVEEYQSEAQSAGSNDFQTFLGRSICGFDGSTFLVCCATDRSSNGRSRKDLQVTTTAASGVFHFSPLGGGSGNPIVLQPTPPLMQGQVVIRPSPNNPAPTQPPPQLQPQPQPQTPPQQMLVCGISGATSNRVVGGQEARRGAYPWIAALGYFEESNRNSLKFLCGGSLIHSHYVITSAHCINGLLTLVRLGAHDLSKPTEAGAMDFRIRRTVIHEQFDMTSIANDIALIELSGMTSATLTANIAPICLPEAAKFLQQDFVGMNPFIAGWGASKHQGPTSQVLRDVQVPIVARQSCEQSYKSVFRFVQFSDKVICAGSSSVDACQGDSGGPLMMPQREGSGYRFYLLGLVSFGYECARPNFPGVYTRVASYVPWIRQQISMG